MQEIKEFLSSKKIAVVGSFRNEEKVAYKILRELKSKGYEVFPVNPTKDEVDGIRCYKYVSELPDGVEAIDIVTPPEITEKIVEEAFEKRIMKVWMQPGAESEKAIDFCKRNGMSVIYGTCIMVKK